MDNHYISSRNISLSWRHPTMQWNWAPSTSDADHNFAIHVGSTLGRFLPPMSCLIAGTRLPLPPPLLPLAGLRRISPFNSDVKLERVPTPTRAGQLLADRGEEHDISVCFSPQSGSSVVRVEEDVKPAIALDDREDLEADRGVILYRQHSPVDVNEAASSTNAASASDSFRPPGVGDWTTATRRVPDEQNASLVRQPGAGVDEVDLTESTDDHVRPSVVRRRLLSTPRCVWTTTSAAQRRAAVAFDAKYLERRRKNNEAAKRSRDVRRANERRVALRAALLERENEKLRAEVGTLTDDTLRLHYYLLCSRTFACNHCHHRPSE